MLVADQQNPWAAHNRADEMVTLGQLTRELRDGVDAGIELSTQFALSAAERGHHITQGKPVGDHHDIHIASHVLMPASHGAVNERPPYPPGQRREGGAHDLRCAKRLTHQPTKLAINGTSV